MESLPHSQHEYQGDEARSYEQKRTSDDKWQREQEAVESLLGQVASASSVVLDVPVGTGRFLPLYEALGCRAIGLDISPDMLEQARGRVGSTDRLSLAVADITALDMPDDEVDVALCVRFTNLVPLDTVEQAVRELARVSKGHVVLGVRTHSRHGALRRTARRVRDLLSGSTPKLTIHSRRSVERLLVAAGLAVVESRLVAEGPHRSSEYHIHLLAVRPS